MLNNQIEKDKNLSDEDKDELKDRLFSITNDLRSIEESRVNGNLLKLKKILIEKITLFLEFSYKINKTRQILRTYKKIIEILKKAKLDEDSLKDPGHRLIETKGKKLTEFENNLNRIINEWYVLMNEIDKKFEESKVEESKVEESKGEESKGEESKGEDDDGDNGDNGDNQSVTSGFDLPSSTLQPLVSPRSVDGTSADPGKLFAVADFRTNSNEEEAVKAELIKKIQELDKEKKLQRIKLEEIKMAKQIAQQIVQQKIEEQQKAKKKLEAELNTKQEQAKENLKKRKTSRPNTPNVEKQDKSVTESTSNKLTPTGFEGSFSKR